MSEAAPVVWSPDRSDKLPSWGRPAMGQALLRGLFCTCPACGKGRLFAGYLTVSKTCCNCAAPLDSFRSDDAPPYFTIMVVGHFIVPLMLWMERAYTPELWVHTVIWVPLTLILSLVLIRPIKGATLGLMLRLGMNRAGAEQAGSGGNA